MTENMILIVGLNHGVAQSLPGVTLFKSVCGFLRD
jgi:hypothetical protein